MAFDYNFPVPPTDPSCKTAFTQTFHHKDWIDGVDVVQAQSTADEDGFNLRLHRIEQDIASLGADLANAFNCIAVLRSQINEVLGEIKIQFNLPPAKTAKEGKDVKDFKDGKDGKDGKDTKDTKDVKDSKDGKDGKDTKDGKDGKDGKDTKDTKDGKDGKDDKDGKEDKDHKEDKDGKEKEHGHLDQLPPHEPPMVAFFWGNEPVAEQLGIGHAFIRPDERPLLGERALTRSEDSDHHGA